MRLSLFCLSFFAFISANAQKNPVSNDKRIAALDSAFERALKTWKGAGFAVAVVEKDRIIYAKGFGYRDVEKKLPVTPNTLFAIGSCTKAFTCMLIGMLQKEGKLDIDKPAHQYLQDLAFFTPDLTNSITLRDMMSHRTGLPRHDFSWYLFNTGNRDSLFRRIQYQEPTFPLRRQWQYNNFMFVAQGVISEKISGKSWENSIREKFFVPLNMNASNTSIHDLGKQADAAKGYGLRKDSLVFPIPYYDINAAGPAGSINSNVLDMSQWVMTWINGGKYKGREVLPAEFMKEAISAQAIIGPGFPSKEKPNIHFSNYGFGWFLSSYKGHYRVDHGGNIDGFSANTSFFPTDSIGIIVLANQNGSALPSIVRNLIADRLLNLPYFNWNDDQKASADKAKKANAESEKSKTSSQKTATRPSHEMKAYEGLYSHPGYGSLDIRYERDSLFAYAPNKSIWLKHYHYDVFQPFLFQDNQYDTSENNNQRIQFVTGINGDIESANLFGFESAAINLNFKKGVKEKPMNLQDMEQYTGIYEIGGSEIKFYTKGNSLFMFVAGQPEYEMVSTGSDGFSVKNLNGYSIQFLRNDQKKINAVNLIQPNGTFKANKKS